MLNTNHYCTRLFNHGRQRGTAPTTSGRNTPFSQLDLKKIFISPLNKPKCSQPLFFNFCNFPGLHLLAVESVCLTCEGCLYISGNGCYENILCHCVVPRTLSSSLLAQDIWVDSVTLDKGFVKQGVCTVNFLVWVSDLAELHHLLSVEICLSLIAVSIFSVILISKEILRYLQIVASTVDLFPFVNWKLENLKRKLHLQTLVAVINFR